MGHINDYTFKEEHFPNGCSIYNADCFEFLKTIPSGAVRLVISDPLYNLSDVNVGGTVNKKGHLNATLNTFPNEILNSYDIEKFAEEIERIQGKNINAYFWCNKLQIPEYFEAYVKRRKCKFDILCWHKCNVPPTYSGKYLTDTEYCLFFHKGECACHPKDYLDAKTFYVSPMNVIDKRRWKHPTVKHIEFCRKLIRNSTYEGDTVLDPFMGCGTFVCAAFLEKRKAIGVEINPEYFEIAKRRIGVELSSPTLF